jgi:FkbM family methyltransferase
MLRPQWLQLHKTGWRFDVARNLKTYALLERLFGRRFLARAGRFLYLGARRELVNSPEVNGEYALIRAVCRSLRGSETGHVCFDVGANLGDWSAELLSAMDDTELLVYPFEPAPAQYAHISSRLKTEIAAGRVIPQKLALAAEPGTTSFLVTGDDSGNNAIATKDAVVSGQSIVVELDTVDNFCARHALGSVTFIKVDTEGNDYNVIAGASQMLTTGSIGVLQFEYNWRWVAFGHMLREVFQAIEGQGYAVAQITQEGLEVHAHWHPELERFFETNFALIRADMLVGLPHRNVRFDAANTLVTAA